MNIILLSGGSGQRLWPLSNNIRSKQFVPFFKNEAGTEESMLQRVYRQIRSVNADVAITIASGKSQISAIKNQLGDAVSICAEPCRKNTFPAIILAAAYLRYEKGVAEEEPVVVCPVDPYVEQAYYEAVDRLGGLAAEGKSSLLLMGISPNYPSEKYGYIIPENAQPISRVKEFKEKPTAQAARRYIASGALWNAGVFAFKLGYLLGIARETIEFSDYRDLYAKYNGLDAISFDYAVAEREPSIRVLRYAGDWRDIGTWNTLTEVMADTAKGNVITDDTCEKTHIVNELDIPILCVGLKDVVVAASSDGILIADKERSSHMKPYVEKLDRDARFAEKSWGTYTVIDAQPNSMTVKVRLHAGSKMNYHSHQRRDEVWTVVSGYGRTYVDGMEQMVRPGDVVTIAAGCKHTLIADESLSVIEVQIGEDITVEDKTVYLD